MEMNTMISRPSSQRKCLAAAILILIFIFMLHKLGGEKYCKFIDIKTKVEYICFEEPDKQNKTGIEDVKPLPKFFEQNYRPRGQNRNSNSENIYRFSKRNNLRFTEEEEHNINNCIKNFKTDFRKGHDGFWDGDKQEIRRTHHKYLVPDKSVMIEVGGNVGEDAQVYLDMYKPKHLVILEPLKLLYQKLQHRFQNYSNAIIYNVGIGAKYEKFMIKMEGNVGDATSPFLGSGEGTCSLKVVNAIDFFEKLGVGNYQVDLMTINCEGCEYDLLEALIATDLIYKFNNIQFGTHPTLKHLRDPVGRYCRIQEWFHRSHKLTYQYKFTWETWRLKDLP